jgi:hypothetical protein
VSGRCGDESGELCPSCGDRRSWDGCGRELAPNLRDRLVAMVRRMEWAGDEPDFVGGGACCPVCEAPRGARSHAPNCELAALLEEVNRG